MDSKSQKKKRPILRTNQRKPKEQLLLGDLMKEVSRRTGYRHQDIKEVFLCTIDVLVEELCKKKKFLIPKIGMIYPTIKRGRFTTALNGGTKAPTKHWMPSRWVLRLQPGPHVADKLKEVEVTSEEEEEMYYGNN